MGSEANWERLVRAVLRWERLVAGAHGQPVSGRASASAPVAMGSGANCERLARAALRERLRAGAHGLAASGIAGNVPYNIIPLDAPSIIPEVKAAVSLLKCYRSLRKLPYDFFILATWKPDMLDLLQYVFGFQKGNVSNQREHLILLLANTQSRPGSIAGNDPKSDEGTVHIVFSKCLENYIKWCSYLSLCPFWNNLESGGKEKKLLYLCLYFLIWGEASNIRFLPECLCYIFHYMAGELEEILSKQVAEPANSCKSDSGVSFLDQVISPLYDVIAAEAANNDNGQAAHSAWRNYDDFNEYFWSRQCLQLGWPMCLDSPFFLKPDRRAKGLLFPIGGKHYGKTSFVEHRTFLHLYHSFHRLWIFLFMMFQGLAIIAFNKGNLNLETGKQLLSLGPTYFVMKFLESIPDILMMYGANSTSCCSAISSIICRFLWFTFVSLLISSLFVQTLQDGSDSIFFKIYVLAIGIYAAFRVFQSLLSRIPACHRLMLECDKSSVGHNFVGRGMYEKATDYIHYSLFWLVVLGGKFSFAYFLLIKPLVLPTQSIVKFDNLSYSWNDFSKNNHNALSILSLWAPVFCIYLLDTQLFYTIFSALYGFLIGAKDRLGEIRSVYAVHKFFGKFPSAFMEKLYLSQDRRKELITARQLEEQKKFDDVARFAPFWNEIIKNLREEDYITNLELDLLLMPKRCTFIPTVQWPMFLLARKIFKAMDIAVRKVSQDELWNIISRDEYMKYAVEECYYSVRAILRAILEFDNAGLSWVDGIFEHIEESIEEKSIQKNFQLSLLPLMISKITALTEIFRGEKFSIRDAVFAMKNLYDVVHRVIPVDTRGNLDEWNQISKARAGGLLFANLKWPGDPELKSQINRLHSLLAIESAENVPINLVARRRLEFFTNSLFMQMPAARPVSEMLSFCVLTPYYSETVLYSFDELQKKNEDGITILFYLQKIFPDEWKNFLSRIGRFENAAVFDDNYILELRFWASYRGQTLARTVRGMMYYRKALMLQSYLERLSSEGSEFTLNSSVLSETQGFELSPEARAQADIKFTYVVTCQIYGKQREERKPEAADIALLMQRNEALRVAYIDVVENLKVGKPFTEYFSKLVKADIHGKETEVYSVKLPGNPKLGEGKPENQNHAIIFTRGSALQTIDMNQDNYFEEALKMRNLLEEFHCNHGLRQPTILGVREHVFSGSVSSLASFMSNQETSFVTLGQRVLAKLLKVRMHYGHPDVFDRIFHITRGGISKASRVINISEDIYAGFNSTLRQGNITHHEYIQVGKGRDVGFNQIAFFEGKVAGGNGEQVLSRDVYRLGQFFDFFRMLSFYFTTVGFYFSTMLTVLTVYIFLYGKAYLAFSGAGEAIQKKADVLDNTALNAALNAQFLFQIGIFSAVPMILEFILEQGFLEAIISFAIMQLQFCCVFFTFSLGTRAHYFGRTILHGGAKYHATGRGFGVRHIKFAENYRLYSRSHFVKGLEVVLLLIVYFAYGYHKDGVLSYIKMSITSWFMALSWLFAPYAFNPSGFEWRKTKEDFQDWKDWLLSRGEIGIQAEKSWEAWWDEELAHIRTLRGRILETILSLRFLLFQYGIVYKLHASGNYTSLKVYGLSWIVVAVLFILVQVFTFCKKNFDNYQFLLRFCLITSVILVFGGLIFALAVIKIAVLDIFACCLAFLPTGWAILSIAVAWKPLMEKLHLWTSLRAIARVYDAGFGMFMFIPIAFLSLFPFVSTIQTRVLFNEAFSRGLEISHILAGENNPNTGS